MKVRPVGCQWIPSLNRATNNNNQQIDKHNT